MSRLRNAMRRLLLALALLCWATCAEAAWAAASLTTGNNSNNPNLTASISPSANSILVLGLFCQSTGTPTVTGNGLTWTQRGSRALPTSTGYTVQLFTASGASPSAGQVTINFGSAIDCGWTIDELTGGNITTPFIQAATGNGTGTALAATLAAFENAGNATFAVAGHVNSTFTPGTNFTELNDVASLQGLRQFSEWQNAADTSVDATGSASDQWAMVAVELDEVAAAAGTNGPRCLLIGACDQ